MTSCAAKASPPLSRPARLPSPGTMMVAVVVSRCAPQQDQALTMSRTSTPPRRQRISQRAPYSRLLRAGHCQQSSLAPRTPDKHRRLPPPTLRQAPDADDRDPVYVALAGTHVLPPRGRIPTWVRRRVHVCGRSRRTIDTVEAVLAPPPGWGVPSGFEPIPALGGGGGLPLLLTRVGGEQSMIAETVAAFITAAQAQGASLDVIDVTDGQHGFDTLDHTDDCRRAVCQALSWVTNALRRTDRPSG